MTFRTLAIEPAGSSVLGVGATFDQLEDAARVAVELGASWSLAVPRTTSRAGAEGEGDGPSAGLVIDALRGMCWSSEGPLDYLQVPAHLARSWRYIVIRAHGDGMHLNLGSTVLCGLRGETESRRDGTPLPGGCTRSGACKKSRSTPNRVDARDLRTDCLALLSCNSANLAPQMHTSTNSVVLAAMESGGVTHAIGTTRAMKYGDPILFTTERYLQRGYEPREIVRLLNQGRDGTASGFFVALARTDAPEATHATMLAPESVTPERQATPLVDAVQAKSLASVRRLADGDRVLCGANLLRGTNTAEFDRLHEEARSAAAALRTQMWALIELRERNRDISQARWRATADSHETWLTAMAGLVVHGGLLGSRSGGDVGDALSQALRFGTQPLPVEGHGESRCQHCAGRVDAVGHSTGGNDATRVERLCAACGSLGNVIRPYRGRRVPDLRVSRRGDERCVNPGQNALVLTYPMTWPELGCSVLTQVRDKSVPTPYPVTHNRFVGYQDSYTVPMTIPAAAGSDIFSARCVVLHAGAIELVRCVFAVENHDQGMVL